MADAFRSAKNRIAKSYVSSTEHMDPVLFSSVDKPSEIPYTPRKRKSKKRRTKERANNTPDSVNNGHEKEAKVEKKISQPPQPAAHSNCHKTAESVTCAEDNNNNNVKAIKPSVDEGSEGEKESSNTDTPANVEGQKDSRKTKSLKDLTSGATSKPAERSLASNCVLSTKPETTQVNEQETRNSLPPEQSEEKASLEEVPSIPSYRRKLSVFIKGKKQPKASGKDTSKLFPKKDGSSGCSGNVDKHYYGSGTSGQLTAPKIDMPAGERKENNSADSHDDKEMISSFFKKLLENGPKKGTKSKQGQFEIFVVIEKLIFRVRS